MIIEVTDIVAGYEDNIQILKDIRLVPFPEDQNRFILIIPIDTFETSILSFRCLQKFLAVLHNWIKLGILLLSALMVWNRLFVIVLVSVYASQPDNHFRVARVMPLGLLIARIVVGSETEGCSKTNIVEVDWVINVERCLHWKG